jgi:putative transposase
LLSFFGGSDYSRKNYLRYVRKGIDQGRRPELVAGGLIRSMGSWSAVLSSRRRGERDVADQRILGDGDFVKQVISSLDDLVKKNLRLSGRRIDIKTLAEQVSERYNVSIGELRSGSRRRAIVKARREMSWIGVRELGYSGADVARYLGVTNSCVTRMISTGGKQDIDDINLELLTFGTNVPYYVNQLSAILPVSFNSFVGLVLTPLYPETGFKPH